MLFIDLVNRLRSQISRGVQPEVSRPPTTLSKDVSGFLCDVLGSHEQGIVKLWEKLSPFIWLERGLGEGHADGGPEYSSPLQNGRNLHYFLKYGLQHQIGFYDIGPLTRVCLDLLCAPELTERSQHEVMLFMSNFGTLPAWSNSLYCHRCATRYHPNYYVHDGATQRTYYPGVPYVLQGSKRFYFDTNLCERFQYMMVCTWASATNCACVYNLESPSTASRLPVPWSYSLEMDCENVWDGFFLYSLLLDCDDHHTTLSLDHNGPSQAIRLSQVIEARNAVMVGPGQPHWNHAYDLCCELRTLPNGESSTYCDNHSGLSSKCVVVECPNFVESGHQTCTAAEHRALELQHNKQNHAMFQLQQRLKRLKIAQTEDLLRTEDGGSIAADELASQSTDGINDQCSGKPDDGNRKFHAEFGRRRTHNEELCVATCGVILGWATFYGSEGPNGVQIFYCTLFPTSESLPGVIYHDNNCNVKKVIESEKDTHFQRCALPVDVFHMKTKHKESDDFCNSHCNPINWPELTTTDGQWRFNSSAAEITNAWFGGFQAIVREMRVDRYNFFLDEMIKLRNEFIVMDLRRRHKAPYNIPQEELLGKV
ncbi:hypothetical protein JAAARDRAFT_59037 [Jaapia argillacea MUCL 33604]|uniref:CxC5 like cysteine cluster associated with KDZ domain-containing protein n=1 Tax=Jaapia argillacea MUCL 33604 TaxID=933084 RepID=A0A067PPS7_9AGAM|nr:hypothetical protein JAAARDRAFT_59037 [Jaapia argillacea MUCL 33604]